MRHLAHWLTLDPDFYQEPGGAGWNHGHTLITRQTPRPYGSPPRLQFAPSVMLG